VNTSTHNETTTWLTRKEAAAQLRLSAATLANWASLGLGPRFSRIGGGRVLYRLADVEAWMDLQTRRGA
jgi:predicted DNA-binding transcriptional regulator AlpA